MSSMPQPSGNTVLVTYADDGNALCSGPKIEPICKELNSYLSTLDNWFKQRNLFISPAKCSATLFTTWTNEMNTELPIFINNEPVPTVKKPKLLGVTFDNLLNFTAHAEETRKKLDKKNNILKALAGSTWGKEKEVLLSTYKTIGRSILNYCTPIWTPYLCKTAWNTLQVGQNNALRTITGCVKKSSITHLHDEVKMLPVQEHSNLLAKQFLLRSQKTDTWGNVSLENLNTTRPRGYRPMRNTLQTEFGDEISHLTHNQPIDDSSYKRNLKQLHTAAVRSYNTSKAVNPILGERAPDIDRSERDLPRKTRVQLAQLRSGHSIFLNSYKRDIGLTADASCPDCHIADHTTNHLFNCSNRPTNLNVKSLWNKPLDAARFLDILPEDGQDEHG